MNPLTALGSIVVALITAYYTVVYKLQREHALDIDKELRQARIEAYKQPWSALMPLSAHNPKPPGWQDLDDIVQTLTNWYYQDGGLYLTTYSQPTYVRCVTAVRDVARSSPRQEHQLVDAEVIDYLYEIGSAFRTEMTLDLGSRFESDDRSKRRDEVREQAVRKGKEADKALRKKMLDQST